MNFLFRARVLYYHSRSFHLSFLASLRSERGVIIPRYVYFLAVVGDNGSEFNCL